MAQVRSLVRERATGHSLRAMVLPQNEAAQKRVLRSLRLLLRRGFVQAPMQVAASTVAVVVAVVAAAEQVQA